MTRRPRLSAALLPLLGLLVTGSSSVASSVDQSQSPAAHHRLLTAIADPAAFSDRPASIAFARTRTAGASVAKIVLFWDQVAPRGKQRPASFDATDPADPRYRWRSFDALVKTTVRTDLEPLVVVANAPTWATRQPHGRSELANWNVDPERLAEFMDAAA
jgi:hypothetical protein